MSNYLKYRNRTLQVNGLVVGSDGITGPGAPATGNVIKVREVQFNSSAFIGTAVNALPVNMGEKVVSVIMHWNGLPALSTLDIGLNNQLTGGAPDGNGIADDLDTSVDDGWFNSATVAACRLNQIPDFGAAGYITVTSSADYSVSAPSAQLKIKMLYY